MIESGHVLNVSHLTVDYGNENTPALALRDVSLSVDPGEFVGLVGESGSGKSTLAYAILRLLHGGRVVEGSIEVSGQNVYELDSNHLRKFRWETVSMVFQGAMNSLNPVLTVEQHIFETIRAHDESVTLTALRFRTDELLDMVEIDKRRAQHYPHQLSGGMKQRVVIALAIALNPKLVIMDEPTTALDVVVQRAILDRIGEIQKRQRFAVLFITHDLSLVEQIAQTVSIMYAGKIVETTPVEQLLTGTLHHPYTRGLLNAIPELLEDNVAISSIPGHPPEITRLPSGCAFHPRCLYAKDECRMSPPILKLYAGSWIACERLPELEELYSDQ
ncbi:MAG: ABC transporter ATP-binding protein [Firmicutes bacterium]|jgi:peptide/nickel transport system ATP-binding protein|nr:ABC transporter ATP-binding protein [Bacillota bacterium]